MPELPEVETVVRGLRPVLEGDSFYGELVVYSVTGEGGADRAGLEEGDVLRSWVRPATDKTPSSAQGGFGHPLELRLVEIEQANIAPVTLDVRRNEERVYIELGSGVWLINARPALAGSELVEWRRGEEARGTDATVTRAAWRPLIDSWRASPDRQLDAIWLELELARVLQDAGDLETAEQAAQAVGYPSAEG